MSLSVRTRFFQADELKSTSKADRQPSTWTKRAFLISGSSGQICQNIFRIKKVHVEVTDIVKKSKTQETPPFVQKMAAIFQQISCGSTASFRRYNGLSSSGAFSKLLIFKLIAFSSILHLMFVATNRTRERCFSSKIQPQFHPTEEKVASDCGFVRKGEIREEFKWPCCSV